MPDEFADLREVRAVGAVVVRGSLVALERFIRDARARADLTVIYVRTGAGRLRIVAEEGERP